MKQYGLTIAGVVAIVLLLAAPAGAETWGFEVADNGNGVGHYPSLALDSEGFPHISYTDDSDLYLRYASWDGTEWATTIVDSDSDVYYYTSLALDSEGFPHISYYDNLNRDLKYAVWNGTGWTKTVVDSDGDVGIVSSLALDSEGFPHIGYCDYTNVDLKYASWDGTAWVTGIVDSDGDVGGIPSLALDSEGFPHIGYCDYTNESNHDLLYASWNGTAWETAAIDSAGDMVYETSLALDPDGFPHISYYDNSNGDLKYVSWDGTVWTTTTVDSGGDVGSCNSLALDSEGFAHISYTDTTNADLKYASWDGTAWVTTTVDSVDRVGYYPSLALDSFDAPHISYLDSSNGNLKYAWVWNAPVAGFIGSPTSGPAPLTVNFTDTSTNIPTNRVWYFGSWSAADGGVSTLQNPSHTYDTPGTYPVSLTVWNPDGEDKAVRAGYITVTESVPSVLHAAFTCSPVNGTAPLTVVFNDTSTGLPDDWSWSFGDGDESAVWNATHTYRNPGIYDVTLTVSNVLSIDSLTKREYITVSPPPVSTYDIPLSAGWNLISVPVTDPVLTKPPEMTDTVYGYDPANQTYAEANLSALKPGVGYWVSATADCTLVVNGSYMSCYQANLSSGWNMIGALCGNTSFASPETVPAGSVQNSLYAYSPASGTYVSTATLLPCCGYWASATGDCILNVSA